MTNMLIILDGWGVDKPSLGNAITQAHTPNFNRLKSVFSYTTLIANGEAVGLPSGQMGNSEVGHLNIGAGRIVYQDLTRITNSIKTGDFFDNANILGALQKAALSKGKIHLCGLLSDGGVHSHIDHLFACLDLINQMGITNEVYIHAFLDGRDVGPKTALGYITSLMQKLDAIKIGKIATIHGRYYAMDRDGRWDRISKSYNAMVYAGASKYQDPVIAIKESYAAGITDEFFIPVAIVDCHNKVHGVVSDEDTLFFFNFRPDRVIQICQALTEENFTLFDKGGSPPKKLSCLYMTKYSEVLGGRVAFPPIKLTNTLGQVISESGMSQLRIAETEKYPHVTYFMNGGAEETFAGEKRLLVASPKVATYDLKPEMSAFEITEKLLDILQDKLFDVIILNFANPDMVGHSGLLEPTIKAVETVDICLGKIIDLLLSIGGKAIIIADHGNADKVIDGMGCPYTAHTVAPVPCILTKKGLDLRTDGILADVAPTFLDLLEIKIPPEMTGRSLIRAMEE